MRCLESPRFQKRIIPSHLSINFAASSNEIIVSIRSFDGIAYSDIVTITVVVDDEQSSTGDDDSPGFGAALLLAVVVVVTVGCRRKR